jgi:hypothetical protein
LATAPSDAARIVRQMQRDDEVWGAVVIEEWLLHLCGPVELDQERVRAAQLVVEEALSALVSSVEPELASLGVQLRLMTPTS